LITWIALIVMMLASLIAGYLAARAAPDRRLVYGALAPSLTVVLSVYGLLGGKLPSIGEGASDIPWLADVTISYLLPAFGAAGALIEARVAATTILRWAAAVLAAAITYCLVFASCFALTRSTYSFTIAVAAGILAGYYAAPPHQRQTARLVLAGAFAAIFILVYACAAIAGWQYATGYLVIVVYVGVGCTIAMQALRQRQPHGSTAGDGATPNGV